MNIELSLLNSGLTFGIGCSGKLLGNGISHSESAIQYMQESLKELIRKKN